MITFDSPLSLFTTLFGWQFYNIVWDVLVGTGIAFIPFLALLISTIVDTRTEGDLTESLSKVALSRLETQLLIMLIVIGFAGTPTPLTSFQHNNIQARPYAKTVSDPTPATVTPAASGSTYDAVFGCPAGDVSCTGTDISVPAWWYGVIAFSEGFNRAVIAGMPPIEGLRDVIATSKLANIADPAVEAETNMFYSQCFVPARSKLQELRPAAFDPKELWLGSSTFLAQNRFYRRDLRARVPIEGFPYDASRDFEWETAPTSGWGKPTCRQWWLGEATAGGAAGLREKLIDNVNLTAAGLIPSIAAAFPGWATPGAVDNFAVRKLIENNPPSFSNEDLLLARNNYDGVGGSVRTVARELGLSTGRQDVLTKIETMLLAAPMLQALIKLGIFGLLPFLLVASRYSLSTLIVGAVAIFTVSSWSSWWYMASWVDENLMKSFWPDVEYLDTLFSTHYNTSTGGLISPIGGTTKFNILNLATASTYIFFPLIFSGLMGLAGYRAAQAASNIQGAAMAPAINTAATGAFNSGKKVGAQAITAGRKMGK